jgi:hypothetical protein
VLLTQLLDISGIPLDQFTVPHPGSLLYASRLAGDCLRLLPLPPRLPLDLSLVLCALPLHLPRVLLPRECQLLLVLPLDVVEGPFELLLLRPQLDLVAVLLRLLVELDLGSLQLQLLNPHFVQLVVNRIKGLSRRPLNKKRSRQWSVRCC